MASSSSSSRKRGFVDGDVDDDSSVVLKRHSPEKVAVSLDPTCTCDDDELKPKLDESTITTLNEIFRVLEKDDPGIVVQILNAADVHSALGLPSSPVPQGVDSTASTLAFREWLIARALATEGVTPANQFRPNRLESVAFQNLSCGVESRIVLNSWLNMPWVIALRGAGIPEFCVVIFVYGQGRGVCTMMEAENVFH